MSLERFKTAQADAGSGFATALRELQAGQKTSHWIWYIFPQLACLGRSSTAQFYGIKDFAEACTYLNDALLRERLIQLTGIVEQQLNAGVPMLTLLGSSTDCAKLASSLTLFRAAGQALLTKAPDPALTQFAECCDRVLEIAASQGYPRCATTLATVPAIH
jgi:uncharacterized protein (DUF1810 family)